MITLGIDCTSEYTSIGVSENGTIIAQASEKLGRKQSSSLPAMVEALFADAGKTLTSAGLITVATGPGFYTGIRAGIAYSCALALSLKVKICAVCTLELMAYDAHLKNTQDSHKKYIPIIKARKNFVYAACYDINNPITETIAEPEYMSFDKLSAFLSSNKDAIIVCDNVLADDLKRISDDMSIIVNVISGGSIACFGETHFEKACSDYTKVRGLYLREPDIGPTSN